MAKLLHFLARTVGGISGIGVAVTLYDMIEKKSFGNPEEARGYLEAILRENSELKEEFDRAKKDEDYWSSILEDSKKEVLRLSEVNASRKKTLEDLNRELEMKEEELERLTKALSDYSNIIKDE